MQLDVVYCDQGEQTCVAVAVPIAFPRHCDDGELSAAWPVVYNARASTLRKSVNCVTIWHEANCGR